MDISEDERSLFFGVSINKYDGIFEYNLNTNFSQNEIFDE